MGKVIGVFSGKGGVGKTTLVANLATSLAKVFNRHVVVIDSNVSTSNLGLHFGLYEDPSLTLREVLLRKVAPTSALYIHPSTGVRLLTSPLKGIDGVSLKGIGKCVDNLCRNCDIVIVDAAPGLGREVIAAVECADAAMVVATPDIPSVTDAMKTINLIRKVGKNIEILGLVVNRVRNEKYELTRKEIESACNVNVITHIPEDAKIPESIAKGTPVVELHPYTKASISFNRLAAAMIGEAYEPNSFMYTLMKMLGVVKDEIVRMPSISEHRSRAKLAFESESEDAEAEEEGEKEEKKEKKEKREKEEKKEEPEEEIRAVRKLQREVDKSVKSDVKKILAMKIKKKLRERGIEQRY